MKLYYFTGACSLADHIVLEWIGAPYETERMTLASVKSPEFLAVNPDGTVPVLTDGDFVLTQNAAILTYLAERFPEAELLGDGSLRGRAEVMRWLGFLNSDVHPAFKPMFAPARYAPDPALAGVLADTARANVRGYLDRLDRRLAGRPWLADRRSVADAYLFVMLRWAARRRLALDGLESLARFSAQMHADRGVRAALAEEEGGATLKQESTRDLSQAQHLASDRRVELASGTAGT